MELPCLALTCVAVLSLTSGESITLETGAGTFIGMTVDVNVDEQPVTVSKFLGIPYAEPPVGDLRFQKPVPKAKLDQPLVTQKHGPECVQVELLSLDDVTSEDCLYLNVYAPQTDDDEPLAVMVWIYGGGFFAGSSNIYVADKLAATGNVIVVTINYRVSAMGFLNVGDSNAPGNYGLWDQHLAIKWVHANIHAFGGDNERITIFGESAGAGSVVYQGLYPGNKGLFHRIISQSGSVTAPWASTDNALGEAKELAELVDCNTDDTGVMMACLRAVPATVISQRLNDFASPLMRNPFPFLPSFDNDFVKYTPRKIFQTKLDLGREARSALTSFDLLIGANAAEGATCVSPFCGVPGNPDDFRPNPSFFEDMLIPLCVKYVFGEGAPSVIKDLIKAEYTDSNDPENPLSIRDQFVDMYGDVNFVAPMIATAEFHANYSKKATYVYHFIPEPEGHVFTYPSWLKKAAHADDLMYVFGSREMFRAWKSSEKSFEDWETQLSKDMMTMWSNFAKTGNPNKPRKVSTKWKQYTQDGRLYLEISNTIRKMKMKTGSMERRALLWNNVLPSRNIPYSRFSDEL